MALPATFNFAEHIFEINRKRGSKVAYVDDHGVLSYGHLEDHARRLAAVLLDAGVKPAERVLLLQLDSIDWPVSFLGCLYAGIVPVAVNTLVTADDCAYILEHSAATAALVSSSLLGSLQQGMFEAKHQVATIFVARSEGALPADAHDLGAVIAAAQPLRSPAATTPQDPAFWLYSSGTTGRPKGTVHAHGNPWWTAELFGKQVLALAENDVCFSAAKMYFAYGLGNSLTFPLSVGATVVLMAGRPTPDEVFKRWVVAADRHQPTVFFGAPTGYVGILASASVPLRNQVALRVCSSAGEALPGQVARRFKAHFGCEIIDGIGSTEMLHIYLSNRPGDIRYGTTGKPVDGYDIELRSSDDQAVADGAVGELYVKGPSSALLYWGNPQKNAETFQNGWTKSGDNYSRDADGYYTYVGRSDDMLRVSGLSVSPFEVESTLLLHPAVLEAAVIGTEDADGLTKPKAYIVLNTDCVVTEGELQAFVKERLAPHKYPRLIEFTQQLPKTDAGKIQRFRLRQFDRLA